MKRHIVISLVLILLCHQGWSQSNFSLYNLNNTAQSLYENPAFRPSSKVGVSFAPFSNVIGLNFLNSGFAIEDVLQPIPNSDSLNLTLENVLDKMSDVNYFDIDIRNEFLALGYTGKRTGIHFTFNHITHSSLSYPKGLLQLAYYGNGSPETIGQRIAFDDIGYNLISYLEFGLGMNQKIGNNLVIGGKLKYLVGLASFQTETSNFGIFTDEETFAITIDGAAKVNMSNSAAFFDGNITPNIAGAGSALGGISNNGIALDLGFTYDIGKKGHLSGSIIDWGRIKWRNSVVNYEIEPFDFQYNGVDLIGFLEDSSQVLMK